MINPKQTFHAERIFLESGTQLEERDFSVIGDFVVVDYGDADPAWFPLHSVNFIRGVRIVKQPQASGSVRFF